MSQSFFTVAEYTENTVIIERSKFICCIRGVSDEQDAKDFIEQIRKKHSMATHNCYAYIADDKGLVQKFSDDGEPQGTAGLPMLEVLKNKKMFKTVAVVTRYFGGIKLGTGGLTRAYSGSVSDCLQKATVVEMKKAVFMDICVDYEWYSKLLKLFQNDNISVLNTNFRNSVNVEIAVTEVYAEKFLTTLADTFNGKLVPTESGKGYHAFLVNNG